MPGVYHRGHHATALLLALFSLPWDARAEDWPQWRGPNRDGAWHETGIMEAFPAGRLEVAWRVPVGRGWSSPVVAKGRVYVTDVELTPPTARERVLCFSQTDGKPIWSHRYSVAYPDWAFGADGGGPRATPIVEDGKVYTIGAVGHLFCLDAVTGAVVWEKGLANDYQMEAFSGITASPLIEGELLILYICGKPDACVVALDRNSGKEAWRALSDTFSYSSPIVLTAGGKRQVIVWTQEAVTSLDPGTGKIWWRMEIRTPGDCAVSTPVYSDGRLLVGGLMLKLDPDRAGASVLWPESKAIKKRVLSNTSTAMLRGGHVFSAKTTGELVCLDAASGGELWATNAVTFQENGSSIHLTPNGDSVLLFTDQGNLIRARLSAEGYQEISRAHLLDPTYAFNGRKRAWAPPAYADRRVLVRSDKELVCTILAAAARK